MTTQAIVVGAGFAGLLSARILADHFDSVVLLDRDTISDEPTIRAGVPQAHHQHHLLPGGLEILEYLFPRLTRDLDRLGGKVAGPGDWFAYTPHGKTFRVSRFQPKPIPGRPPLRMQSRAVLEQSIRSYVHELPNVQTRYETRISDIKVNGANVSGVVTPMGDEIRADLVVDASGRVSRTLGWLRQLGYPLPPESVVECDFGYSSLFFKPGDPHAIEGTGFMVSSAREGDYVKRGGSIVKIEADRWLVTLAGRLGDHPPKDLPGFFAYIDTLHTPAIQNVLKDAEPVGKPHQYLFPRSINRHYERLDSFPDGLLPIGDAICHINPGYAQGMSLVCRQVSELDSLLKARTEKRVTLDSLWRDFFPRAYEQSRAPWLFAALMDFSKFGTTGDFPDHEAVVINKLKHLSSRADAGDEEAADLVDAVFDMQRPISALLDAGERPEHDATHF